MTVKDTKTGETTVSTVKYGDVIDFSEYKTGESVYAKVDGTIVKRITVNSDIYAELQYSSASGGTGKIVILVCCWSVSAVLIAIAVIVYKKRGKKSGEKQ